MVRVWIIDRQAVARRGLVSILAAAPDVVVTAVAAEPGALPPGGAGTADVVIFDPYPVGEPAALDAVAALSTRAPVLLVSAAADEAAALAGMRAGARGYLTKHAADAAYPTAIRCLAAGGMYFAAPHGPASAGLRPPASRAGARAPLSVREQQALAYVGRGFTHQQTATRMGVSKATVDTYIGRVRSKLNLGNKAELALAALRYVEPRHRVGVEQRAVV
jgi:two-component system, NarL family, nitrate/nitrite response regulator NarL